MNKEYLKRGRLRLVKFGRRVAWLDTGTPESLLQTTEYVATIEHRQGFKVACIEEVAYRMGYIDASQVMRLAQNYSGDYRTYLRSDSSRAASVRSGLGEGRGVVRIQAISRPT